MEKWLVITSVILAIGFLLAIHVLWLLRQVGTGDFPAAQNYWFLRELPAARAKQIEWRLSILVSLAFAAALHFVYGIPFMIAAVVFLFLAFVVFLGDKVNF